MEREIDFEKPVLEIEKAIEKLRQRDAHGKGENREKIKVLEKQLAEVRKQVYRNLTAWQTVQVARHPKRPVLRDYIEMLFSDFVELHGDRCFGDDPAMQCGFATLSGVKVMLIGSNKGKNVEENIKRNFGMSRPEGYRKALRMMRLAERFNLPIVCLVDTPAAFPGLDAEERGQHEAIARNLTEMARLEVPVVVAVTGEGGSGGALAIGVGDAVLMLQNAIYSVIPPEGCAAILWRDASFAPQAAEAMKVTAKSLLELGVIDEIIPEPDGGAHRDPAQTAAALKEALLRHLKILSTYPATKLLAKRFEKFSGMGKFNE
jgi:acetyl-CoA carboxylase carboxyl transferase subunit alpha